MSGEPRLRKVLADLEGPEREVALGVAAAMRPGPRAVDRMVRVAEAIREAGRLDGPTALVALRLSRSGEFSSRQLMASPDLAAWIAHSRYREEAMDPEVMARELRAYGEAEEVVTGRAGMSLLRRFRHRQVLRIYLREIEGASLRQTTAEISDVASVCMEYALRRAAGEEGCPEAADGLVVFGMGKLGGRELNFSSDVDLVFAAGDEALEEIGVERAEAVVRRAVEWMEKVTDEGQVFRVDLRLRPEGSRGRLILSATGLVEHYLNWGRTWERGAWLKARPIAGDLQLGEEIIEGLEPFLYRRYLDFEAIDELRRMKAMIDEEGRAARFLGKRAPEEARGAADEKSALQRRLGRRFRGRRPKIGRSGEEGAGAQPEESAGGLFGWDVKIGEGGIREVEFFVQALQLVHCGSRENLRVRGTLEALDRLLYGGLVSSADHAVLVDAYDLFRRVEHRVQMEENRQVHRLPRDSAGFEDLAGRMEREGPALMARIEECCGEVRRLFERLFTESPKRSDAATVGGGESRVLPELIGVPPERLLEPAVIERLEWAGFERPRQVAGHLQVLRQKEQSPFSTSPAQARPDVARYLLSAVEEAPDPEAALSHLLRFATALGPRKASWQMLQDHPHGARLLVHLFGSSPPLARLLASEPDLFERLIYGGSAQLVRPGEDVEDELRGRLQGIADRARRHGRIRRFHGEEMVRIALHEVAGVVPVEETCRQLTALAEAVVRALFREVAEESWDGEEEVALSVVAMGKFGSREMGFGSDLDFLFVYSGEGPGAITQEEATGLARRLVRALSAATAMGNLYEVDLRLRPSGSQGTLVVSDEAFLQYHQENARFWERQALLRARPITGTAALKERLETWRVELGLDRDLPENGAREIVEMRQKMGTGEGAGVNLKLCRGGLVDLEFLAQWEQLQGRLDPELRQARSVFEVVRALGSGPLLKETLLRDYRWLRRLECRLSIAGVSMVVPDEGRLLRSVARQMGHQGEEGVEAFRREFMEVRRRVQRAWESTLLG